MSIETVPSSPGTQLYEYTPSPIEWLRYHDDALRIHRSQFPYDPESEENLASIFTNPDPTTLRTLVLDNGRLEGLGYGFPRMLEGIRSAIVMVVLEKEHQDPDVILGVIKNLERRLRQVGCEQMELSIDAIAVPAVVNHYSGINPSGITAKRVFPGSRRREFVVGIPRQPIRA